MHVFARRLLALAGWVLVPFSVTFAAGAPPRTDSVDTRIEAQALRALVEYLAADSLEGRGPGTHGIDAAARFIAGRFREAGLQPAGPGDSFFQEFEATIGVRPAGRNQLRLGGRDLVFESDWMAYGFSDTGTTRAGLVFAGYGITAPEYKYDDYAGLDVKGKVALVLRYEPGDEDSASAFAGRVRTPHSQLREKAILAREHGAVGLLVVTGPSSSDPDQLTKLQPDVGYYSTGIACGQVRRSALQAALPELDLQALQRAIDTGGKPAPQASSSLAVEWSVGLARQRTQLRNVIGLQVGRDPHHAIVIGAHYDHLGFGGPESLAPDQHVVHNGADDNASGTAALIELARYFTARPEPPAQTLVFAAFSGEELGLVGSSQYVKSPPYPLQNTTAMLNMDMIGRLRDRKLLVFGTRTAAEFPALLDTLNAHGPRFQMHKQGDGYGPSDQTSFYKKNLPVLHFFTGPHSEYHKPTDDAALLNYDGLAEVTRFVAQVADAIMQQPLRFVGSSAPPPAGDGAGGRFRASLGTIPDYGQDENVRGVLLSGVRAGSAAEKAGIRGGDIIVQIDATTISNIYDFTHILQTRLPDEHITITVLRNGERKKLEAVLGEGRP